MVEPVSHPTCAPALMDSTGLTVLRVSYHSKLYLCYFQN